LDENDLVAAAKARHVGSNLGGSTRAAAVLVAARAVFFKHGFAAATTDMIQRVAGVSKSTLYAHFPNKGAIFAAVIAAECTASIAQFRKLRTADGPIHTRLIVIALAYLDILLKPETLALFRVVIAEAPRTSELARSFYQAGPAEVIQYLEELIGDAASRGELDIAPMTASEAAALLANMIRGEALMRALTEVEASPTASQKARWAALAIGMFLRANGVASPDRNAPS
jgi:AcrR family transcriptional regulator